MSRKSLLRVVLSFLLAAFFIKPGHSQSLALTVDGQAILSDAPPVLYNGQVMVPARAVLEALGEKVRFYPDPQTLLLSRNGDEILLNLDKSTYVMNGISHKLESPVLEDQGHLFIPLNFVVVATGAEATWDRTAKTVRILSRTGGLDTATPTTPYIESVTHPISQTLHAGDHLSVEMSGEPGGKAFFDVTGATVGVPMIETTNGRYTGSYVIQPGTQLPNAYVVAHLRLFGQESLASSPTPVSIDGAQATLENIQVRPQPETVVSVLRPHVEVFFSDDVSRESLRFNVDGEDQREKLEIRPTSVVWIPVQPLSQGEHHVTIEGKTTRGDFSKEWNFYVTKNLGVLCKGIFHTTAYTDRFPFHENRRT